jgi:hypothetical protein
MILEGMVTLDLAILQVRFVISDSQSANWSAPATDTKDRVGKRGRKLDATGQLHVRRVIWVNLGT